VVKIAKVRWAVLNVTATEDDGGWQHRKPYQPSSSSPGSHQRLHHHDNRQAQQQQQQQRDRAVDAVWQSASVTVEDDVNKEVQQLNNSGGITVLAQ